jgi:hypothetical protein
MHVKAAVQEKQKFPNFLRHSSHESELFTYTYSFSVPYR